MIKRVSLVTRKPGMPVEEFQRYWREVHAPLALAVPGLRRYIQSHTLPETYDSGEVPVYDGVVETWWDTVEVSEAARRTPERALVDADQPNFIGESKGLIGIEIAAHDGCPNAIDRRSMLKTVSFLHKRSGVSVEAFQTHWRDVHGPVFAKRDDLRRYTQTFVLPESYGGPNPPVCDGLAMSWHDSLAAFQARVPEPAPLDPDWTNYREYADRILTREIAFLD